METDRVGRSVKLETTPRRFVKIGKAFKVNEIQ